MSTFRFRPSARLQKFLGQELIADPNLAIIEFVKNAYDAGAGNVYIDFKYPLDADPYLVIRDDGAGMNAAEFETNWMHPGYSSKSSDAKKPGRRSTAGATDRVPVGEKGLGRLAAGRLGSSLEVFTRKRVRDPWLHVLFDWADFDDMTQMMDEVKIAYDHIVVPDSPGPETGTLAVIHGLSQKWDGRVRGRPVAGRSRTKLGRLKQDLRLLVRPLQATDSTFAIHLASESVLEEDDIGTITPEEAVEEADYIYDFAFDVLTSGKVVIKRVLRRSRKLVDEFGGETTTRFKSRALLDVAKSEARPETLMAGPFQGRFYYTPPPKARRAKEVEAVGSGVLLYRDGVLVEPYGLNGDDWVGVGARKAQRQGYALVQPTTFSGYVLLTRDDNPELRDMSNRLGLLDTDTTEEFIQHVRKEFSVFEAEVFEELKKRWESKEEKAGRQSEESLDLAAVRLRAIAHSLGQPMMGLSADIKSIRLLSKRKDLPDSVADQLAAIATSAEGHLEQAQGAMSRFRDIVVPDRSTIAVSDLVTPALSEVGTLAASCGVTINAVAMPDREVFVHGELVREAIKELIRNAVEAPRSKAVADRVVQVAWHDDNGNFVLDIIDNGSGIPALGKEVDLASVSSTKGRPGEGLATVVEIITASRGRIEVVRSGAVGTHIAVTLPDRIRGLRSDDES